MAILGFDTSYYFNIKTNWVLLAFVNKSFLCH
jgi:hypothetical protein